MNTRAKSNHTKPFELGRCEWWRYNSDAQKLQYSSKSRIPKLQSLIPRRVTPQELESLQYCRIFPGPIWKSVTYHIRTNQLALTRSCQNFIKPDPNPTEHLIRRQTKQCITHYARSHVPLSGWYSTDANQPSSIATDTSSASSNRDHSRTRGAGKNSTKSGSSINKSSNGTRGAGSTGAKDGNKPG